MTKEEFVKRTLEDQLKKRIHKQKIKEIELNTCIYDSCTRISKAYKNGELFKRYR